MWKILTVARLATVTVSAFVLTGCLQSPVPSRPPKTGPGVDQPVTLKPDASPLHRCTVAPVIDGSPVAPARDFDVLQARTVALEADARLDDQQAISRMVKASVREANGMDSDSAYLPPDPWQQAMAGERVNLLHMIALSLQHAVFRTGRSNYTADVGPVMDRLDDGEAARASQYLAAAAGKAATNVSEPRKLADSIGTLGLLERGAVHMAAGDIACAREFYDYAVADFRKAEAEKSIDDQIGNLLLDSYSATGFETVMAVNYKSIADFLANDDRVANNVRLARVWQKRERVEYQEEVREAKAEIEAKKQEKLKGESQQAYGNVNETFASKFDEACVVCDEPAERVENPYVNPLADFLSAAWSEQKAERARKNNDSLTFSDAHSTALVAYKNAADLNPANAAVQDAIKSLEAESDRMDEAGTGAVMAENPERLVHLTVDVGRAPERQLAKMILPTGYTNNVPLQIPYYRPVARHVDTVWLETTDGEPISRVTPLADVEAMAMAHFQDELPIHLTKATMSAIANYFLQLQVRKGIGGGLGNIAGGILGLGFAKLTEPGTESWTTLPHTIGVARARVPASHERVALISYDADGRQVARSTVSLKGDGPVFIYGRSAGESLTALASDPTGGTKYKIPDLAPEPEPEPDVVPEVPADEPAADDEAPLSVERDVQTVGVS